jgi:EAL domain-containing protein (putative c-di-GMP-specific phosphodiesterase class I)
MPLGQLRLQLVATAATSRRVLLPRRAVAPLLHQAVAAQGYGVEQQPAACQEAEAWIKRARDRQLALPISPELLASSWLERHGLQPLADQPVLVEQLWLLLPQGAVNTKAARQCLRLLRAQIAKAQIMQDPHRSQC